MVTCVENNIYRIPIELKDNPLKNLNAYLIKGADRNLLIDTGFRTEDCKNFLLAGLSELHVSMDNTDIFLTHLHADHIGLATVIAGPNTRLYMSADDIAVMGVLNSEAYQRRSDWLLVRNGYDRQLIHKAFSDHHVKFKEEPCDSFIPIREGDMFCYGGLKLKAIQASGHTPGHMCLYEESEKIMFLGDHVLFDITPNITAWPRFKDPLGEYIKSLLKIRDYDVRLPLPAHREIGATMPERIDEIIEHHAVRLRELLTALEKHPQGASAYELAGEMSWNIHTDTMDTPDWESFPDYQKWFAVGETVAHLDYFRIRNQIRTQMQDGVMLYYPIKKQPVEDGGSAL